MSLMRPEQATRPFPRFGPKTCITLKTQVDSLWLDRIGSIVSSPHRSCRSCTGRTGRGAPLELRGSHVETGTVITLSRTPSASNRAGALAERRRRPVAACELPHSGPPPELLRST
jgi:hypothetical protein